MTKISCRSLQFLNLGATFLAVVISIVACNSDLRTEQRLPLTTGAVHNVQTFFHNAPTSTATATATDTPKPPTLSPTRATIPSIEAKATIIITQRPSVVLITPTRAINEREDYIRKMLNPTANCQPPCWWGLTPGLTSWKETQDFFYGLNAPVDWISQKRYGVNTVVNHFRSIKILLEETNSLLENILIIGDQSSFRSIGDFPSYWKGYSPENVLKAYGPPTRILLRSEPLRGGDRHPYSLFMIYDDRGFTIYYSGFTKYGQVIQICPKIGEQNNISLVKIFLQSKGNPMPLERMGEWEYPDKALNGMLPFEEATGMSIDAFYKAFTTGGQLGCFPSVTIMLRQLPPII